MPMSQLEQPLNINDIDSWGVRSHGTDLRIQKDTSFGPLDKASGPWIIDVENNPDGTCAGIGLANTTDTVYFFTPTTVSEIAKDYFSNVELIGHNIKHDVQMLRKWGFDVSPDQIVWDTQVAEYVKDSTKHRYGLKKLTNDYFGASYPDYKTLTGAGKKAVPIGSLPIDVVANYCGCDVLFTAKLYFKQQDEFTEDQRRYFNEIELSTLRVLLEMEERGVWIDADYIRNLDTRFGSELEHIISSLRSSINFEFNPNSHQQIKQSILDKTGISLKNTTAETLQDHENIPLIKDVLRYRQLAKLKGTYTRPLLDQANNSLTYKLHARFNQTITQTGRLSSSDPNLQNIPAKTKEGEQIRQGFIAAPNNYLIDADYSQIEPRLMAHFSQDPVLLHIFKERKDLYDYVAAIVECDRKVAKVLWLAMAYNAGPYKIAKAANIGIAQARNFLDRMHKRFKVFFYWKDKVIANTEINKGITTMFGRFIPIPIENSSLGPNYLIQGTAAEIMKLAMQATREFNPIMTVHDELVFEGSNLNEQKIKDLLENVVTLNIPLQVEIGKANNWMEAKQ